MRALSASPLRQMSPFLFNLHRLSARLQAHPQRLRLQIRNPTLMIFPPNISNPLQAVLIITIIIFEFMQQPKAIPFIVKDNTHDTYHLTPEAENLLAKISTPISVVTVAGLYRTGKSYLLNRVILNRAGGFGVGPTVNPCTKGLWIWGEPISISGRTLLVVDTEGLGALDEQSNHDMKIFCLAVLLSSTFIYNSVGSIDEPALQTLSLVLNLIAGIDKDSYSSRPNFLWVVRDFALQLINEKGQQITPSQYLEGALSIQNQKQPQKLQLRKTITEAFTERECFTLIKPLIDQTKLQNLDKVSSDQLRPEFVSQTIALRKYIYQSLKEIKLNNTVSLKGQDYMLMCKKFLDAINTGAVPDMLDTWGYIKEEKARQVAELVRESYTQKLRNRLGNKLPMPTARLNELLQHLRQEAVEEFLQLSYEDASSEELCEYLSASQAEMHRLNAKESKSTLNEILRRQFEPFQKKLLSKYYSDATSYEHDLRNSFRAAIQQKFAERIDLPLLEIDLYTEKKIIEGVKMFEKHSRDELARARESRSEIEGSLQNEIRNMNRIFDEERRKFQEEIFELEKKIIILGNQKQRLEDNYEKGKRDDDAETGRIRRKAEESQQVLEGMQRELDRMQKVNGEQERQFFFIKKELQKEKALSKQKEDHLQSKLGEIERRAITQQQQFQSNLKNWQNERREILSQSEMKYELLAKETKELNDHLAETFNQLQHEKFTAKQLKIELETAKDKYQEEMQRFRERFASSAKKDTKAENDGQLLKQLQESKKRIDILSEQLRNGQARNRQLQQQLKLFKSQNDKQEAISSQKIEFQQMENQQLRTKLTEVNAAYQRLFDSTQYSNAPNVEQTYKRKINDIEMENARVIKQLESEYENKFSIAKREVSQYMKEKDEVQLQLNLHQKRWEERERYLQNSMELLKRESEDLKRRLNNTQEGHAESQREKETYYSIRVRQLETEIEEVKRQASVELEEIAQKSEETVAFIKSCSEKEKSQFEKRLEEEREKRERKIRETNEEWSQKLNEEKDHYEGIINELEGRLVGLNNEYSEQLQAIKSDADIRIQKLNNAALEERMQLTKKLALVEQQAEITKVNLTNQLEERTRQHYSAMESLKKELLFECEQQIRAAKEAMQEVEGRLDSLKKANRKSEESNLLLKSELDKEKALGKEKQQAAGRRLKELEERFAEQLRNNTKIIEQLNEQHTIENRRLNEQIERLKELLIRMETERTKLEAHHQEERSSLITKYTYMETKCKRSKDEFEDLLRKFETTVKTLSNQKPQKDMQREMEESYQRLREQYHHKIKEKEDVVNQQRKQAQEKIMRLQTENKSLRDKLLLFEMRQTQQSSRYDFDPVEREKPDRALIDIKSQMDREKNQIRRYYNK